MSKADISKVYAMAKILSTDWMEKIERLQAWWRAGRVSAVETDRGVFESLLAESFGG